MKGKPKLYIKNDKGRYEPYAIPTDDTMHTLYRKVSGKYVPWGRELNMDVWTEGVWVVTRHRSCKEFVNGQYLRECFTFDRVSNLEDILLSGLASLNRYVERVMHDLRLMNDDIHAMTNRELVQRIVALIFDYDAELKKGGTASIDIQCNDILARSLEKISRQLKYNGTANGK